VGTVPQLTTAVWVGRDDNRQLASGATGGVMVTPIWRDFMTRALRNTPAENFKSTSQFRRPSGN
jgi:membrane carboxypeptidase/penicillin-binding protein